MAGPGRRLDATGNPQAGSSKSTISDVYIPPKRTELTSEARYLIHQFQLIQIVCAMCINVCIFIVTRIL